jgi:hypothetical protein
MDMLRACYRTKMRLHTDPSVLTPVRWYKCHPNARDFPGLSPLRSSQWRSEPWVEMPLGEVYGAPRPFDPGLLPLGAFGRRFCGPIEWFRYGEPFPSSLPPQEYSLSGLATCCLAGGVQNAQGGMVAGGTATEFVVPPYPSRGGAVAGGTATEFVVPPDSSSGGAVAGGTAESWSPTGGTVYHITPSSPPRTEVHRLVAWIDYFEGVDPANPQILSGPNVTGTAGYWTFDVQGISRWDISGWDGTGSGVFTKVFGPGVTNVTLTFVS